MLKTLSRLMRWCVALGVSVLCIPRSVAVPPTVISTEPPNGAIDVDPSTAVIRIEFDQDMNREGHSVCGGGENFPELIGKAIWKSPRIFVMPVKLKSDHDYALSINCPAALNFRSASGEAATPLPLTFSTAGVKDGAETLTAEANRKAVHELRDLIDTHYSYRDRLKLDWDALFKQFDADLLAAQTPAAFARVAARLLAEARDLHVSLRVGPQVFGTHRVSLFPNSSAKVLARRVSNWKAHTSNIATGRFDDGIGYILVGTWGAQVKPELEFAYAALTEMAASPDIKGIILDVRPNTGGDELLARELAGCFIDEPAVYSRSVFRDPASPTGFGKPIDRLVSPTKDRPRFAGKVALLMGPANVSSCESFILMMMQSPRCETFGEQTYGSSGNPRPHELSNGVTVVLPSWQDLLPDGTLLEGQGIKPKHEVKADQRTLQTQDPVLDAALKWLRGDASKPER